MCSYDKAWDTAYYLQYSHNGYYGIWKATGGCGWAWIQPWTYTAAINQGDAWNELKVWCVGDQMYFFINDVLVYVVTDNSFNTGKVGLSYFAGAGGGFRTDYATLEIVGVAARPVAEVSKQQRLLNEKAKRKNARLPKEYCSIKKINPAPLAGMPINFCGYWSQSKERRNFLCGSLIDLTRYRRTQ